MRLSLLTLLFCLALVAGCAVAPSSLTPDGTKAANGVVPPPPVVESPVATQASAAPSAASAATAPGKPGATHATAQVAPQASPERDAVVQFVAATTRLELEYEALLDQIGEWQRCCQADASDEQKAEKARGFLAKRTELAERIAKIANPPTQDARLARDMLVNAYGAAVEPETAYLEFVESGDLLRLAAATDSVNNFVSGSRQARDALADLVGTLGISPQEAGVERFP